MKSGASAGGSLFRVGIGILVFRLALVEAREVLLNYQFKPSIACADSAVETDLLTLCPFLRVLCGDDDRNLQRLMPQCHFTRMRRVFQSVGQLCMFLRTKVN